MSLIAGISPRSLAFQQNEAGNIDGFVMDGLPFMSLRKLPLAATPSFNYALLGFSFLVFLAVLLRRCYQRAAIRLQAAAGPGRDQRRFPGGPANLLVVIVGAIVIAILQDALFGGIPLLFKAWLVLPIVATIAGLYLGGVPGVA